MDKGQYRKTVKGAYGGGQFEIRMIRPAKFAQAIGMLPVDTVDNVLTELQRMSDTIKERSNDDPEANDKLAKFVLSNGVVSPKIWCGDESQCPEDQICMNDLGGDVEFLVAEIMNFSFEFRGLKEMAEFFRGARPGTPGLPSQALQGEAVESNESVQENGAIV